MVYKALKKIAKRLLGRTENSNNIQWLGDFDTWENAEKKSTGYETDNIINKVSDALIKVKNGIAEYERDSYLFYTLDYNWSLVSIIQKAFITKNKELLIVDFGGSLGSSYFQNRKIISDIPFEWRIIEQAHYVEKGRNLFEDNHLKFNNDFSELINFKIDIILFSSVLQYISNYDFYIQQAINLKPSYIYIDRTSFIDDKNELITIQQTPAEIYEASYVCRFFVEADFIKLFINFYDVIANVETHIEQDALSQTGNRLYWKGFILKRKPNA